MPIRVRKSGKLEWRFTVDGHQYSGVTDLDDTTRNRTAVQRIEAKKRELVLEGRASELRLQIQPFSSAADQFIEWAKGEYRDHPNSWKRIRGSMASAKVMFGRQPLSSLACDSGAIEDYKAWRRTKYEVREVTLRHDLHALSLLFQYGEKHNWCRGNPIRLVEIPSDADAVRINVLSKSAELAYFTACEILRNEKLKHKRTKEARGLQDIWDLHKLMVQQGCRPEELRSLEQIDVDLEHGRFIIRAGKSTAAQRTLQMRVDSRPIFARRMQMPGRWVFPSGEPGQRIGQHQRLHAAVLKRSGVLCVPYDFRHTFASRAANDEGMPLGILASIMGHANLRSIMKYVHTSQEQMDREMIRLDAPRSSAGPVPTGPNREETGKIGTEREVPTAASKRLN